MRKLIKIIACMLILSIVVIAVAACVNNGDDKKPIDNSKVNISTLPDMVDYGQSAYINVARVNYTEQDRDNWNQKLTDKQDEERGYWLLDGETWDNSKYYTFGAITEAADGTRTRQHKYGYLAQNDNGEWYWEDGDSANTVERIFCYSDPAAIIEKLSLAGIAREHTDLMVEYISRTSDEEENREEYHGFTFEIGTSSAIDDYAQLEELKEMYDDWTETEIKENSEFADSDEVSDAINLKNRKIYGEIFRIFGAEVDDFGRASIAMTEYAVEVIETVMMPLYKDEFNISELEFGDNGTYSQYGRDYKEFIVYMREEMYDYDTLSYLIAFREFIDMNDSYEAGTKVAAMTLLGYHYQFKQRDYNVFDDEVTKTYKGETITEYEYFLKLSHKSYYDTDREALDYRDMDRRQYEKAYRYSTACLTKYYQSQLEFQAIQEDVDAEIYVGGRAGQYNKGISYYGQNTGTGKGSGTITYSSEMQQALSYGLDANMKIGDVNWEYSESDTNTLRMNLVSKQWNGLTEQQQENPSPTQRYYKVEYEIELLKSQNYVLTHATITDNDLTGALRYEIKSYSADSVRGIQQNKKNEVIYNIDITRMLTALEVDAAHLTATEQAAYDELVETEGRNYAEYQNLTRNYTKVDVNGQITTAANANWSGIRSNVETTLAQDYKNYKPVNNIQVDKYFEDTLIKKTYSCGGTLEACKNNDGHINCTEEYDTGWALSRLLNEHEIPLRYVYGQIEVTMAKLNWTKFTSYDGTAAADALFNAGFKEGDYNATENGGAIIETIMTDEEIGTLLYSYKDDTIDFDSTPKNLPKYEGYDYNTVSGKYGFTLKISNIEYRFDFAGWYVDENLKYEVLYEESYDYDIRLYPAYTVYVLSGN